MLGWCISVHKQKNGGSSPETETKPRMDHGPRVAVWQTGIGGLDWVRKLVKEGKATQIAWNCGYPDRYTAPPKYIIPNIINGPPRANDIWSCGPRDIVTSWWAGKTVIDRPLAEACRPDEWLLIEAWDES
jgi:hypothetical protein